MYDLQLKINIFAHHKPCDEKASFTRRFIFDC